MWVKSRNTSDSITIILLIDLFRCHSLRFITFILSVFVEYEAPAALLAKTTLCHHILPRKNNLIKSKTVHERCIVYN